MPRLRQADVVSLILHGTTEQLQHELTMQNIQLSPQEWLNLLTLTHLPQQTTVGRYLKLVHKLRLIAAHIPEIAPFTNALQRQYVMPIVNNRQQHAPVVPLFTQMTLPSDFCLNETVISSLASINALAEVLRQSPHLSLPAALADSIRFIETAGVNVIVQQSKLVQAALAMRTADPTTKQRFDLLRLIAKSLSSLYLQLLKMPRGEYYALDQGMVQSTQKVFSIWQEMYNRFVSLLPDVLIAPVKAEVVPPVTLTREAFFQAAINDPKVQAADKLKANHGVIGSEYTSYDTHRLSTGF